METFQVRGDVFRAQWTGYDITNSPLMLLRRPVISDGFYGNKFQASISTLLNSKLLMWT